MGRGETSSASDLRGVLKLGVGEFDAVLFIKMSPPIIYKLKSLRASQARPPGGARIHATRNENLTKSLYL
jgi:hypothetical protein